MMEFLSLKVPLGVALPIVALGVIVGYGFGWKRGFDRCLNELRQCFDASRKGLADLSAAALAQGKTLTTLTQRLRENVERAQKVVNGVLADARTANGGGNIG